MGSKRTHLDTRAAAALSAGSSGGEDGATMLDTMGGAVSCARCRLAGRGAHQRMVMGPRQRPGRRRPALGLLVDLVPRGLTLNHSPRQLLTLCSALPAIHTVPARSPACITLSCPSLLRPLGASARVRADSSSVRPSPRPCSCFLLPAPLFSQQLCIWAWTSCAPFPLTFRNAAH